MKGIYKTTTESGDESKEVAIKILKSGLSLESQSDFEHEIEILSSFKHPNIVKLLGIFKIEGKYHYHLLYFHFPSISLHRCYSLEV